MNGLWVGGIQKYIKENNKLIPKVRIFILVILLIIKYYLLIIILFL